MANEAMVPAVQYEGVWAICLYLENRRRDALDATIERANGDWWITSIYPDVRIQDKNALIYHPSIVCVVETKSGRVLAFRIASGLQVGEHLTSNPRCYSRRTMS